MTLEQKTDIKTVALQGGAITVREKPLLPFGAFSMIQNFRGQHPAFDKRKGSAQHNTTTLGATLKNLSLYQFSKGKRTERHFLAQMSDDDVYDAANAPPATGTTFSTSGAAIFSGTATSKPASWGNLDDILLFSNGKNQHQLYAGTENYVKRFIKFDGSAAPSTIPTEGYDYTLDVTDGQTSTYAILDLLSTIANFECLFICCPVPANRLTWTFVSGKVNTTDAVGTLKYRKSDNTWEDTSETDGTIITTGKTMSGTGSMTWTHPSDEIPSYMYGISGYWYRWETGTTFNKVDDESGATFWPTNVGACFDAGNARFRVTGVDLAALYGSAANDYMLVAKDSSGKLVRGYIDVADSAYSFGGDLFDAGAGIFTSGTYSWAVYGSNTIANDANTLKITHVDHSHGAYLNLNDAADLSSDLTVGKMYKLAFQAKVGAGDSVDIRVITNSGSDPTLTITETSMTAKVIYFVATHATGDAIAMNNMTTGDIIWLDNITLTPLLNSNTDGVLIMSTKGGSTQSWDFQEPGIDLNDIATFNVFKSLNISVSGLTYGNSFHALENVWSGDAPYAIQAHHYDQSATIYKKFAGDTIEIDSMEHEASQSADDKDRLYFSTADPIIAVYIDVGDKPNTETTTTIDGTNGGVKCFTGGETWTTVGTVTDGTNGLGNSGWITWNRPPYSTTYYPQKTMFNKTGYYGYWYYIWLGTATISADVIISIVTMPYFDINELGAIGYVNAAWKDRAIYNFGDNIGYVSAEFKPMTLNGSDFGLLEAGDGRSNRWTCAKKFHNDLIVWQQEKGSDGGCITLFEGYSPTTFEKSVISTSLGTFNPQSAVVIDGLTLPRELDPIGKPATVAFFISHYGIYFFTDEVKPILISGDIQNYFDPKETATCITRGAEDEMFIFHDKSCNKLRLGLVTGASGTVCNTFPVFDLADWTWSFDTLGQTLSAMCEVEAASGDLPILQYGGGTDDGFIYQLNTGLNDYNGATKTKITSYIRMEFNGQGEYLELRELLLLTKTQTAGDAELTVYKNNVAVTEVTDIDLSMIAENTNEIVRRHRKKLNVIDQHISIKIQHDEVDQGCYLEGLGVNMKVWENR